MGFFNSVKGFFSKAAKTISSGFKTVANHVAPTVKNIVNTVYKDAKSVVSFAGKQIDKVYNLPKQVLDKGTDTIKSLGGDVKDIFGSFSWPLVIGGGAVLLILLTRK